MKSPHRPSLRQLLSALNHARACQLLGPGGAKLLRRGGQFEIDLAEQVRLDRESLRIDLADAQVSLRRDPLRLAQLAWSCSACGSVPCDHVAAAFTLVLEEKQALGLAEAPPERKPIGSLTEAELEELALAERQERARAERFGIVPARPTNIWRDYSVTSGASGRSHRVSLRGPERGESFCSCPDFRKSGLGTCKHILHLLGWARRQKPAQFRRPPPPPTEITVGLHYDREVELRVSAPENLEAGARQLLAPFRAGVRDMRLLLDRLEALSRRGLAVNVYPDAEEYIDRALKLRRVAELTAEIRRDPARHPLRRTLLKEELLPYQLDGIAFAAGAGRAILADDMGLGKTIQGLGVAELLAREAGLRKVLVICPASLKSQWRNEAERFSGRSVRLVLGGSDDRLSQYSGEEFFTVCNYEQVLRDITVIEAVRWDLIVLDEGQRIKNWEAKTARIVKGLRSAFALVLTGTPLENRLDDLYSVVEFVDDRRLGPAFRFFNRHREVDERGKVTGYRGLDELREKLKPILLRRTRDLVLKQLPPRTTEILRIPPAPEQLAVHGGHMRTVSSIVRKAYISEMDLLRLRQALLMCRLSANSTVLVDKNPPGFSSKLAELQELLQRLAAEAGRKLILFSEWTGMLDLVEPLLKEAGLAFVRLDGSVPQAKRAPLVKAFQTDPACRAFLSTNAGSTGLNLQAADTVINLDLPWNPAVLEQRVARAHRMGQKRPVQVYLLVTEQTIEENLLGTLAAKHDLALAALDAQSETKSVKIVSNVEELKRRLEVLLQQPAAPPPQPAPAEDAEQAARREKLAAAGGHLLATALGFLNQLLPPPAAGAAGAAAALRAEWSSALPRDAEGRVQLTIALPDDALLEQLAQLAVRSSGLAGASPGLAPATESRSP